MSEMKAKSKISRRELLKMASPLGRLTLDGSKCTGCGLCALDCPTEALTIAVEEESKAFRLLFRHGFCIACNRCIEVCPEQCLSLERVMELDKMGEPPEVLFTDEIALCSECGTPIGPRSMINSVRARVQATGGPLPQLELCPDCKIKAMVGRV